MEFHFMKWESARFGSLLKPIIPVTLIGPKSEVDTLMLLDSGADTSLIPYSLGLHLGLELDLSARSEVRGIGDSSVPYIVGKVTFQISGVDIPGRIGWALIEEVPLIMGRLDIFKTLNLEFREAENKIVIEPN